MIRRATFGLLLVALVASLAAAAPVNLSRLLTEMTARDALARYPQPAYLCSQSSSYDRKSIAPGDASWFANADCSQFTRKETRDGRTEWVMLDVAGPGAIVRLWSANPPEKCNLRFYFDNATEPSWTVDFQSLTGGKGPIGEPLSAVTSSGWTSYLPVPYAKHVKITADRDGFYYHVNYRSYRRGTAVETFTPAALTAAASAVKTAQTALLSDALAGPLTATTREFALAPNAESTFSLPAGSAALREFSVKLSAADLVAAGRNIVVSMTFDGEKCVWAPLTDLFGSGVGFNAYRDWYRTVKADGAASLRFVMPYRRSATVTFRNYGAQNVKLATRAKTGGWRWDARSMHFHATWRWQDPLATRPYSDWNYVAIKGRGVYVGDALAVFNPVKDWWGEGDEKIYVDGETFPSHFGTGSEDYYGYAWCNPALFTHPFHAQSRCDGPGNRGNTSVTRSRSLDAIPFSHDFRFDIECWHWADTQVAFAATTYWYAQPGATCNRVPQPEGARAALHATPQAFRREGAIELENAKVVAESAGLPHETQNMGGYSGGQWSNENQMLVKGRATGDFVELSVPAPTTAPRRLYLYATRSFDYGVLRISVNGKTVVDALDTYCESVQTLPVVDLGVQTPVDGAYRLRFEVVGHNPASKASASFFGLDCVTAVAP